MDTLLVRRLPPGTKTKLAKQASEHGVSVEAEARNILLRGIGGAPLTLADLHPCDPEQEAIDWEPTRFTKYCHSILMPLRLYHSTEFPKMHR